MVRAHSEKMAESSNLVCTTYARSTANCDSMSVYMVLYSIQYEQNVHVYSQLQLFLSYGQCPVPRCPDKGSLSGFSLKGILIRGFPGNQKMEPYVRTRPSYSVCNNFN